jgi:hypothetical protein
MPAIANRTSYISSAPWEDVALKVRAPAAWAPWMTEAAEN